MPSSLVSKICTALMFFESDYCYSINVVIMIALEYHPDNERRMMALAIVS